MLEAHKYTQIVMQYFRVFGKYLRAHAGLLMINACSPGTNMITCSNFYGLLSALLNFGEK